MFDSYYPFRLATKTKEFSQGIAFTLHKYTFTSKHNEQYIVNVEEYAYHFYAIKFYLKKHRLSPHKYQLLTGFNDMPSVVGTCLQIMVHLYKKDNAASFGFVGANSAEETTENTQRFRIYAFLMKNKFSPLKFTHAHNIEKSSYLLLNKAYESTCPQLVPSIDTLFQLYLS